MLGPTDLHQVKSTKAYGYIAKSGNHRVLGLKNRTPHGWAVNQAKLNLIGRMDPVSPWRGAIYKKLHIAIKSITINPTVVWANSTTTVEKFLVSEVTWSNAGRFIRQNCDWRKIPIKWNLPNL